ncbi:MAG: hypothetical protein DI598_04100 [Pseudopedobacter saltans]|uniref:Uncharacterized protein n=1 Tax=Pseudopedobacter saltans TaxID=151895 RepID=A0A2W5FBS6_9SPHI|nr:MAG: hypothetical protein DI598_04100 [Pseudopedobacter saltans]
MMQMLTPETLTSAKPAHAIAHIETVQTVGFISKKDQFTLKNNNNASQISDFEKDIFFAPTQSYKANQAKIKYVLTSNHLFEYKNNVAKEIIYTNENVTSNIGSKVWLGIQNVQHSLQGTHFFFKAPNTDPHNSIYSFLSKTLWYSRNDQPISYMLGYQQEDAWQKDLPVDEILHMQKTANKSYDTSINGFYRQQFITLEDRESRLDYDDRRIPNVLQDFYPSDLTDPIINEKLVWIEIRFPEYLSVDRLETLNYYTNCIPIANKQLYDRVFELNDFINIIPLQTEDTFFDIESISDSDGKMVNIRDLQEENNDTSALLRYGGIARFDERDANATIKNLIQLLRDESTAFDTLGRNFVSNEIKSLQQILNKLEQRMLQNTQTRESIPHLVVSLPEKDKETGRSSLFVEYWATQGKSANGLNPNVNLIPYKTSGINHFESYLVTTTVGGRDNLSVPDKINAYKYALLSHDRIVSEEDIQQFCKLQLANALHEVNISKGMMIDHDPSRGYTKTIDISIFIKKLAYIAMKEKDELDFWQSFLLKEIKKRSQSLIPYRIFLKEMV